MADNREMASAHDFEIAHVEYHGWRDSYILRNGIVEVVVVPLISRIMQFRFMGSEHGVFWENRELDGVPGRSDGEWRNFGGDKAWPAPQQDWEARTGRAWPPPFSFDSAAAELCTEGRGLTLISPIDCNYGVQVSRYIALRPGLAVMDVRTCYRKINGPLVPIGVWVVTQLGDPHSVFALLREPDNAGSGYTQLQGPAPLDISKDGRLIRLRRDPDHNLKIAIDGSSMAWMDEEHVLRIDASTPSGTENRCSMAVYTNMDPLRYVELESEGLVACLAVGDTLELTNTYTLALRSHEDATTEARGTFDPM
jgi:hypothetical protein